VGSPKPPGTGGKVDAPREIFGRRRRFRLSGEVDGHGLTGRCRSLGSQRDTSLQHGRVGKDIGETKLDLKEGRNSLQFTLKAPNKGLTIKKFTLTPAKQG
jgi:hypothetical protein